MITISNRWHDNANLTSNVRISMHLHLVQLEVPVWSQYPCSLSLFVVEYTITILHYIYTSVCFHCNTATNSVYVVSNTVYVCSSNREEQLLLWYVCVVS